MNLIEDYITSHGYDYFGNAAEDTLMFFVHDDGAPSAAPESKSNEAITNLSGDTVNGLAGSLSSDGEAVNIETHAQTYEESGGDKSTNLDISQENTPADNEYSNASVSGSISSPDDNGEGDDISDSIPHMATIDDKQTDVKSSKFKN